jgi:hypothetical protein
MGQMPSLMVVSRLAAASLGLNDTSRIWGSDVSNAEVLLSRSRRDLRDYVPFAQDRRGYYGSYPSASYGHSSSGYGGKKGCCCGCNQNNDLYLLLGLLALAAAVAAAAGLFNNAGRSARRETRSVDHPLLGLASTGRRRLELTDPLE